MEQAKVPVQVLEELRQQNVMLQSTMDTLRKQSRQKDEEIERLQQRDYPKICVNLLNGVE